MLLDHITMTSVDLPSRLTVYKLTTCNKTTVDRLLFTSKYFTAGSDNVLHCLALTDTLRLAFTSLCAKEVVQQFKVLQLWQFCETIHPSSLKMNENQRPL